MAVYAVGQVTVHDHERYGRYAGGFMEVLDLYGGTLLASDGHPRLVEGEWGHEKVVLLEFADEAAFDRWWNSPEYQAIAVDRIASTAVTVLLVKGV